MRIKLFLFLFIWKASTSFAQNLPSEDFNYLSKYLSLSPLERVLYFSDEMNKSFSMSYFGFVASDIKGLTGIEVLKNGSISISGVIGVAFIVHDSAFKTMLSSIQETVLQKKYLFLHHSEEKRLIDSTDSRLLKTYLKNSPKERIKFIEMNFSSIPQRLMYLLKEDLDKIFDVTTPVFFGSVKKFRKAQKIWCSNAQKVKSNIPEDTIR